MDLPALAINGMQLIFFLVPLHEAVYPALGINILSLAGEEGMARRTGVDMHVTTGRSQAVYVPTRAGNGGFGIIWMNISFHELINFRVYRSLPSKQGVEDTFARLCFASGNLLKFAIPCLYWAKTRAILLEIVAILVFITLSLRVILTSNLEHLNETFLLFAKTQTTCRLCFCVC